MRNIDTRGYACAALVIATTKGIERRPMSVDPRPMPPPPVQKLRRPVCVMKRIRVPSDATEMWVKFDDGAVYSGPCAELAGKEVDAVRGVSRGYGRVVDCGFVHAADPRP